MGGTAWSPPPFPRSLEGGLHPSILPSFVAMSLARPPSSPPALLRLATCHLSSFPRKKVEEQKRVICTSLSLLSFKPLKRRDNKPGPTPNFSNLSLKRIHIARDTHLLHVGI